MTSEHIDDRRLAAARLGDALREVLIATAETNVPIDVLEQATNDARKLSELIGATRRAPLEMPSIDDPRSNIRFFSPVRGPGNAVAPPIHFMPSGDGMGATFTLDKRYEGFPNVAHGGIVAMIFDELLGVTLVLGGYWAMTASLTVEYKRAIPIGVELVMRGVVTKREGRKTWISGTIAAVSAPDEILATGESLMIQPRAELAESYFGKIVDPEGREMAGRLDEELGNG